jgi:hypothetical protein
MITTKKHVNGVVVKTEYWNPIPSQPDLMASSLGRIMVKVRAAEMPNGRGKRKYGGMPTYGQLSNGRYIYARRGHKTLKVHRLVCEAFHGEPFDGAVCMHLDEDSTNNTPENLAWGTQKENLNADGFIAYCKSRTGENNPYNKGRLLSKSKA